MSADDRSREQLIEDLHDLRQKCDELLNDLPDALFEWDITGEPRLTYMNRMAYILCGYTEADLERGIPAKDFFADEGEYRRALEMIGDYTRKSLEEKIRHHRTSRGRA